METSATPGSDARRNCSHDTSTKDSIMFLLIQQHLSQSADSACSQPCPDSMRHLPDNTGEWSAVVLAGPTADAADDAHTKNEVSVFALKT